MAIPVQEASEVIAPFLAAGADAAIRELGDQAGSTLSTNVRRLIEKIRGNLPEGGTGPAEVAAALRAGLEDGSVCGDELTVLVTENSHIVARAFYSNSTFNIAQGDFFGDGG
jgi:hypothetical protein